MNIINFLCNKKAKIDNNNIIVINKIQILIINKLILLLINKIKVL